SALVCAGVVEFPDALGLVQKRAKYMQSAVPAGEGAMTAIVGLDDNRIREACESVANGSVVTPVNFNAPGQVVIAGNSEAVARAGEACREAGAKRALSLPVSGPFHTSLMQPAADKLAADMAGIEFNAPKIPVIHNVTVATENDPATIK
ncbi:MAG: ACP S-malonyltransferase, partial [Pseudomonadales bacterium]